MSSIFETHVENNTLKASFEMLGFKMIFGDNFATTQKLDECFWEQSFIFQLQCLLKMYEFFDQEIDYSKWRDG